MRKIVLKRLAQKSWRPVSLMLGVIVYINIAEYFLGAAVALGSFAAIFVAYCIYTAYRWVEEDIDAEIDKAMKDLGGSK